MSDTRESNGKEAMPDATQRKIWQIFPEEVGFGYGTLLEIQLPISCQTEETLLQHLGQSETIAIFEFTREGFTPELKILGIALFPVARARMEFNFYAAKITGQAISGPFTVACMCNEQIVNMDEFLKLCTENGKNFREFKLGTEKQFPGLEGDMLHRLVKARAKWEARKKEEREACCVCDSPDIDSGAAASGSGAAASGSGAAASGSEAAEVDVRRSGRVRRPKQIFDPSIVKREPQGD